MKQESTIKAGGASAPPIRTTHASDHLANERTYLAYLRTAISLMSFGIAINRFSHFLDQSHDLPTRARLGFDVLNSGQLGIGMVLLGMVLMGWACLRFNQTMIHIDAQDFRARPLSIWILTLLVLISGCGGVLWLFST